MNKFSRHLSDTVRTVLSWILIQRVRRRCSCAYWIMPMVLQPAFGPSQKKKHMIHLVCLLSWRLGLRGYGLEFIRIYVTHFLSLSQRTQRLSKLILAALEDSASLQYGLGVYFYCCSVQLALKAKQELQDLFGEEEEVSQECNSGTTTVFFLLNLCFSWEWSWMAAWGGLLGQEHKMQLLHCTVILDRGATWMLSCHLTLQWLVGMAWTNTLRLTAEIHSEFLCGATWTWIDGKGSFLQFLWNED